MKHLATFLYWLAAVFALALILVSFDYRFGRALFLATSLLPGMFCAKFFLPMALRAERRRVFGCYLCGCKHSDHRMDVASPCQFPHYSV